MKKTIGARTCGSLLPPAIVKASSEYTNVIHVYYAICNSGTLNNNYEGGQNRYTGDLSEKITVDALEKSEIEIFRIFSIIINLLYSEANCRSTSKFQASLGKVAPLK